MSDTQYRIQPMGLVQSIVHFGLPAIMMIICYHLGIPLLNQLGLDPMMSYLVAQLIPLSVLFAFAIGAYTSYGKRRFNLRDFREKYRFSKLSRNSIILSLGVFISLMIAYQIFSIAGLWLIDAGILPVPDDIQTVNSLLSGLSGRWDVFVVYFIMLFFNIAGEELWWRGYILPRQEIVFGKNTWMLHGFMWTLFHVFKWWDLIGLLPVCLIISYVSQKRQDNWPSFIAHYLFNGLGIILVIQAVMNSI